MRNSRRRFLKYTGMTGLTLAGDGLSKVFASIPDSLNNKSCFQEIPGVAPTTYTSSEVSIIGKYGPWASSITSDKLPTLSFRRKENTDLIRWHREADNRVRERMGIPMIGGVPEVKVNKQYIYDGLQIEELSWQLPYGRPTEAVLLKPADARGPLPAILAFHDHGGNKYFGTRKITKTTDNQHPLMTEHQKTAYSGRAWTNELARRGYIVLVSDAFTFASRRVQMQDIPEFLREGLSDENPEDPGNIKAYNQWASKHEHIMAKSLFCAGTTWPGVFFAEDRIALDILSSRKDVIKEKIGCGGLSGGGLRTVMMGGLDNRIKCAVCVGFMSTWKDFLLNKSYTHTWMTYVPILPKELDFPEILGLRVPLPTLVLNDIDDDLYTVPEMNAADKILQEVFRKADATDKYKCSFYPGEHKFDSDMQNEAFEWFDKWLK